MGKNSQHNENEPDRRGLFSEHDSHDLSIADTGVDQSDHIGIAVQRPDTVSSQDSLPFMEGDTSEPEEAQQDDIDRQRHHISQVSIALANDDKASLWEAVRDLHEADLADVMEALSPRMRVGLISELGSAFNYRVLNKIEDAVRDQLIAELPASAIWRAAEALEPDDAAELLEELDEDELAAVFAHLSPQQGSRIRRLLQYEANTAGRVMETSLVSVPQHWNVGQTIDYMRDRADLPSDFGEIFVLDHDSRVIGQLPLSAIVSARRAVQLRELVRVEVTKFASDTSVSEVATSFEKYSLGSAAVVDSRQRLIGVISAEVAVNLIQHELEDDIRSLSGVRRTSLVDTIWSGAQGRAIWLIINLITAGVAASVVGAFSEQIKALVALAILLPIVPSVGGNAGIQTLALVVRGIADQTLRSFSTIRLIGRELGTCALTGITVGALAATPVILWSSDAALAIVVAAALFGNIVIAGLAGVIVPIGLYRAGFDPAVSSPIFVTMVTDVAGLAIFLGLGTLVLL